MPADRTQGFFHQYANDFDAIYSNRGGLVTGAINNIFRKSMKLRFIKSIEGCRPIEGKTVLDVGCGPGHYSITLAQRGAAHVVGLDFAEGMLQIAREHARKVGVADRCDFRTGDFLQYPASESCVYLILIGLMDYIAEPRQVVEKALSLTRSKAFFSFPVAGGVLGWQRKLRYRNRCDLFLYTRDQLAGLFGSFPGVESRIEPIARDFFVTADVAAKTASVRRP